MVHRRSRQRPVTYPPPARPTERDLIPRRAGPSRSSRAGTFVRRACCLSLIVVGVVAVFLARPTTPSASASAKASRLGTPIWSARRAPQSVVEAVGAQKLNADLTSTLGSIDSSCILVQVPGLGTTASLRSDKALLGASAQKVLTATAALAALGPEYRYTTKVVGSAKPRNGEVDRAWFIGGGDPVLHTPDYQAELEDNAATKGNAATPLTAVADGIVASGVRSIGTLLVDDSRYDAVRYLPTWRANYKTEGHVGALGALVVNSGFTSWTATRVPTEDPAIRAGEFLVELLKEKGVNVGAVQRGTAPGNGVELATVESPPFRDVIGEMLRTSNNTTAELIVRELAVKSGKPGTTRDGVATMTAQLMASGIPMKNVTLFDGSGLSRDNAITCDALITALNNGRAAGKGHLDDLLAVAGTSGTLASRFQGSPLQGKLRAKTGTLAGVTALGGFSDTYRVVPFAFIAGGSFSEAGAAALQSRVATAIGKFPAAAGSTALVPEPAPPCTTPNCP